MKSYSPRNGNKIASRHVIDDIDVCMYTYTLSSPFPSIGWYIERATMHVPSLIELKRRFARNEKGERGNSNLLPLRQGAARQYGGSSPSLSI